MRSVCPAIVLACCVTALPAAKAWGADRALLQLFGIQQLVTLSYQYDDFLQESAHSKSSTSRHTPAEKYEIETNYAVYDDSLLYGKISLGAEAQQQQTSTSQGSGKGSDFQYDYNLNGSFFRYMPQSVYFHLNSDTLHVSPLFASSYQLQSSRQGVAISAKNDLLPATLSFEHGNQETSGQREDRRESLHSVTATVAHFAKNRMSDSNASFSAEQNTSENLSTGSIQNQHVVSGTLTNRLEPWPTAPYKKTLDSMFRWTREEGIHSGRFIDLKEGANCELGKVLRLTIDGNLNSTSSDNQGSDLRSVATTLEHRLLDTITTRLSGDASSTTLDTGSQDSYGGGINLTYFRRLPSESDLQVQYGYSQHTFNNQFKSGVVFYRDRRLNGSANEVENYLPSEDIIASTIVVWNASRTKTFVAGTDYTVVPDGRRTRLRIEPGQGIALGEALSVDYSTNVNPLLKYLNETQSVNASLRLGRLYTFTAGYSRATIKKLAGEDNVAPVGSSNSYTAQAERNDTNYRTGLLYSKLSSISLNEERLEGYWKYNRELEEGAVALNVSDVLTSYKKTESGGVVSEGGQNNIFLTSGMYRRIFSERLKASVSGQYENTSGRSSSQQLLSTWLLGSYSLARAEIDFSVRMDWRFYKEQYQRNATARIELKRYF
ncbi:hypothetical protein KP005_13680 [Geomonas nitrogeniifigens]|uniref:TIGR03016 family PEP-CTERM system-associated outer membrane protein n=1 Tax=Geomonas diazotrophica TaxID=2843197 RepID=A0ABX8JIC8_9BACT|nr:hypothetical protein [Geomonas nitrogeniifigens]QWV96417.1 hypothetical protein KP005_13680 [Geomonas nitrogeniifigens]